MQFEYEKEYIEAESRVVFPNIEDIKLQCETINAIRQAEIDEVSTLLERIPVFSSVIVFVTYNL